MIPGPHLISYQELAQSPEGIELWNTYMTQVVDIALQHPEHFFAKTAREVIPQDAQRQEFYADLRDDRSINAFCIVTVACGQAEMLWASCRKVPNRVRIMHSLYEYVENVLFGRDSNVTKIVGMCCAEDSKIESADGEVIDGQRWSASHRFHESRGYRFTYRLTDYWGEGSHAFMFMKMQTPRRYGYTRCDSFEFYRGERAICEDTHLELNKRLYGQVGQYLDVFDETFVESFAPEERKSFVSGKRMKGFTGVALLNCTMNTATLFATTSSVPDQDAETVLKFEYDIDESALTQLLASDVLQDHIGIVHYPAAWDHQSTISIRDYCERLYPSLLEGDSASQKKGFTVFYAKLTGVKGHNSVIYFVTPEIENVVWYKPLWKAFGRYSFALILEIYGYLSSLLVLEPGLRDDAYFNSLLHSVSPEDVSGSGDDFLSKIARMKDSIQKRVDAYYGAVVRSRESAIRHYGHTMGHRVAPIIQYFDTHDASSDAAKCATLVRDLSFVLQAYAVQGRADFFALDREKGGRFLDRNERLDLLALIQNDVVPFADKDVDVAESSALNRKRLLHRYPQLESSLTCACVTSCLTDPIEGVSCRPHTAFYTQFLSEIVINAVQHGRHYTSDVSADGKTAFVRVNLGSETVRGQPALVVSNYVGISRKPLPDYFCPSWVRWPNHLVNSGPGMAVAFFRSLAVGEMWVSFERIDSDCGILRIALTFAGLQIT